MECVVEMKASAILQCINRLRGDSRVTFEEGLLPPGYTTR